MSRTGEEQIAFAPFVLDLRAGQLLRDGRSIALRPKTWAVLCYLAGHPGILVSKEDLFAEVWADTAVTDDTLTKSIGELRQALGDDPRTPRFIETVSRRGFRFIAPVRPAPAPAVESADAAQEPAIFVGRTGERQQLRARYAMACRGQRQLVFVSGEPGIGKSAFVENFLVEVVDDARASAAGDLTGRLAPPAPADGAPLVAHGFSIDQRGTPEAYLPLLTAVEDLLRSRRDELVPLVRRFAPSWLAQIPWLMDGAEQENAPVVGVTPERMQRELCAFLEALSATRPACLVLEDLHWSDRSTVELLVMLAQRREPAKLLVIATYRPDAIASHPVMAAKHTLEQRGKCVEIALRLLALENVEHYLAGRFPGLVRSSELAALLHAHTGGNALFLVAVVNDLLGRGWLVETSPGWSLAIPAARLQLQVPESLRAMILDQLDALPETGRVMLECASVFGVSFSAERVSAALGIELEQVDAMLRVLGRTHRFVRIDDTGRAARPGHSSYRFLHAIHWQCVYESIGDGPLRRRLHQRAGETIEAECRGRTNEAAAELSAHFEISRDAERAIRYLTQAALRVRPFAPREAIVFLERALQVLAGRPESPERHRTELDLRIALGPALAAHHGYASPEVRQACEQLLALCEASGTPLDIYLALDWLWYCKSARAEADTGATARRMVETARSIADPDAVAQAEGYCARTLFLEGRFAEAIELMEPLSRHWNRRAGPADHAILGLEPPGIYVHLIAGLTYWFLGTAERARRSVALALEIAEETALPYVLTGASLHAAFLYQFLGDVRQVEALASRALSLSEEHDFPYWTGMSRTVLGWTRMQSGQRDAGIARMRAGLIEYQRFGARVAVTYQLSQIAHAHLRAKQWDLAATALDEAEALAADGDEHFMEPEFLRLRGELLWRRSVSGDQKATGKNAAAVAEDVLRRAIALAEDRQSPVQALRAATSLAALWNESGNRSAAHELLAAKVAPLKDERIVEVDDGRALLAMIGDA